MIVIQFERLHEIAESNKMKVLDDVLAYRLSNKVVELEQNDYFYVEEPHEKDHNESVF